MCGVMDMQCDGLPPPTRGIRLQLVLQPPEEGSTPAHAGNTSEQHAASGASGVYPRPRGEYEVAPHILQGLNGLPPPTRGIRIYGEPIVD